MIARNYVLNARIAKRMTQARLADLVGVKAADIANLEERRYDVGYETKCRILVGLGIPLGFYRRVFPNMPFAPSQPVMPTREEVEASRRARTKPATMAGRAREKRRRLLATQVETKAKRAKR